METPTSPANAGAAQTPSSVANTNLFMGSYSLYVSSCSHVGSHGDSGFDRSKGHRAVSLVRIVGSRSARERYRVASGCQERELVVVRRLGSGHGHLRADREIGIAQ